ncbi:hypothetical protein [Thiohalomonas denitrificans]|uniref:hypothetical protein n=1 Tax=Thiohalomonas denitrificans TaxID=415747 RepID=UPI0011140BE4|nr:hypothetical protein [Thiohalomonas denitrificans]
MSEDYVDDPSILDETRLFRRVILAPDLWIVWDNNRGAWRPTSVAFDNDRYGSPMSVVLEDTLAESGRPPESALEGHDDMALAAITAQDARSSEQIIVRDPVDEEPAHGLVVGSKSKKIKRHLSRAAVWVVPPQFE